MTPQRDTSGDYLESFLTSAFGDVEGDTLLTTPSHEEAEETPEFVARYPVVGTIGRGGIGVVYRVRDEELGRELAVKVLRPALAEDDELNRRFVEEARICSRLQHPGVVPVHEVGALEDGRPYFTMKVVEGKTLDERLSGRSPDTGDGQRDLEVFAKIAQTLAYAHAHGVVHGDVKSQNVMVGAFGEVQLMDWGFAHGPDSARHMAQSSKRTRVIGTPAYMAPEQAKGAFEEITTRTDVFGLGAILCEILSGAPPYLGASKSEVCARAARADLTDARARLDASGEDGRLVALALRCMEADPSSRPADAAAVAGEITLHLDGLERKARRLELEAAEARAVAAEERRSRRLTLALTLTVVSALIASAASLLWIERDRSSRRATIERGIAAAEERAALLRREALAAPAGERALWDGVRAAILEAARLARSPDATDETVARVTGLAAQLEAEADRASRDADRLDRIAELRPHMGDDRSDKALDAAYAGILADVGVELTDLDLEAAAGVLRDSPIRDALVDALDEWVYHRRPLEGEDGEQWRAILSLANAVDDDPWRHEMRDGYRSGDVERLRALAEADLTKHASPIALDLLARALIERGDRAAAIALFRRAARLYPGDFWIHHNLAGQLHTLRPRPADEILRHLHMALAVHPHSAHARTDLALELILQRQPSEASEMLEEARRIDPGYRRASLLLGMAYIQLDRPIAALEASRRALRQGQIEAWPYLVQSLQMTGAVDEAITFLEERLAESPDDALARYQYAAILADDHRDEEAFAQATRAIELDPTLAPAYAVRALVHMNRGEYRQAEDELEEGIATGGDGPNSMPAPYRDWLQEVQAFQMAVPFLDRILAGATPPEPAHARSMLAAIAFAKGEVELAAELFDSVLPDDTDPEAWQTSFLAARAAAAAGVDSGVGAPRTIEYLRSAVSALEAEFGSHRISPHVALQLSRKWCLAPELAPLYESDDDAIALRRRIDAIIESAKQEALRRERAFHE